MVKIDKPYGEPVILVKISPQSNGNFYPYSMSLAEFKAAVGGSEKFDGVFIDAVKKGIEQSKASAAAVKEQIIELHV